MRVLVTGANGYLGRAVVAALRDRGHEPIPMVRAPGRVGVPGPVRVADLHDPGSLREAVREVDAVCHLAGRTRARESLTDPLGYFRTNATGTLALLDAMTSVGIRHIVFASTGSVYGTPDRQPMTEELPAAPPHPYAASKLAAELALESFATITLRMLNIAGGADPDPTRLLPRALTAAGCGTPLTVNGDGSAVRDYLHIADAADAFTAAVDQLPAVSRAVKYNVGSGVGSSVKDVVAAVERVTGLPVSLEYRPAAPEPAVSISDPSRAIADLGWSPRRSELEEIVRDAWSAQVRTLR
ncbi:NAD-dependent epimerase/dehydratase family protein [Nocardia sp. NPDC057227]|uniref:NAD-dependent epimerase/dehydratase family protein n=1 Tax=Nocardia sp. NPDC057227 TaxID=3346056 RepID=UPI00362F8235